MSDPTRNTDADPVLGSETDIHDESNARPKSHRAKGTGKRARETSEEPSQQRVSDEIASVPVYREESPSSDREDEIRTRAYYRYLDRGADHGDELQDWLEAEREERDRPRE